MDAVAYKDVMDCAEPFVKIAGELRNMVSLDARAGGDYIEVVVLTICCPNPKSRFASSRWVQTAH